MLTVSIGSLLLLCARFTPILLDTRQGCNGRPVTRAAADVLFSRHRHCSRARTIVTGTSDLHARNRRHQALSTSTHSPTLARHVRHIIQHAGSTDGYAPSPGAYARYLTPTLGPSSLCLRPSFCTRGAAAGTPHTSPPTSRPRSLPHVLRSSTVGSCRAPRLPWSITQGSVMPTRGTRFITSRHSFERSRPRRITY